MSVCACMHVCCMVVCVCVCVCVCVLVLNYVNPMFRKALEEVRGDETPSSAAINRNS